MSDNELTSEDLIAAWRTTASGQDNITEEESILDSSGPSTTLPPGYGISIDDIVAAQPMVPEPSGLLLGAFDGLAVSGLMQPSVSGYQFEEYSYVNQPADQQNIILSTLGEGNWTLSNMQPNALVIDDGNGGGVKINFNGEIELLGETKITDAAKLFWDLVQIEGVNAKGEMDDLKEANQKLEERVKELEIKLGYRKADVPEEEDNRFEGILDE